MVTARQRITYGRFMMRGVAVGLLVFAGCSESPSLSGTAQGVEDPDPQFSIDAVNFIATGGSPSSVCGSAPDGPCSTAPSAQVRWGIPAYGTSQSGLGFENAASTPSSIDYGVSFKLGELTHFNVPTQAGTNASGATLRLGLLVEASLDGTAIIDTTVDIPFVIDETSNYEDAVTPCPYPSEVGNPCSDKITFGSATFAFGSSTSTTVYDLQITGFVAKGTTTAVDSLISDEDKSTSAELWAFLRQHCIDAENGEGDGVCDEVDNCVNDVNTDQADADGDGKGDVCDVCPADNPDDGDNDGECGIADPCPCDADWNNHGEYEVCVVRTTRDAVRAGEMTAQERAAKIAAAAQSSCGK
jgi:hypothetical protein